MNLTNSTSIILAFLTLATVSSLGLPGCADTTDRVDIDEVTASAPQKLDGSDACSDEEIAKILEVTHVQHDVTCSFTLPAGSVVYRPLRLYGDAADGVTIDCNGSSIGHTAFNGLSDTKDDLMIEVRSKYFVPDPDPKACGEHDPSPFTFVKNANGYYERERPEHITIKNCDIRGRVRIWGLASNDVCKSSRDDTGIGHTVRARDAAPQDIVLDNVTINTEGFVPLFLSPGVTRVQVLNSKFEGTSNSSAIYMSDESCCNTIRNTKFLVNTEREVIAVDGSSYNLFVNNWFTRLEDGGVFLYRNCGEKGTVRWRSPHHNQFINNFFNYNTSSSPNPAIYIGSRDGDPDGKFGYCGLDSAYDFGSGADDRDFARYNTVMQNQFRYRSVSDSIDDKNPTLNSPNYVKYNETVSAEIVRKAGCYLPTGFGDDFILDGQTFAVVESQSGGEACVVKKCIDGALSDYSSCTMQTVPFGCSITDNNAGCSTTATCPSGTKIIGAKAACNLETTGIAANALESIPAGTVDVVTLSQNTSDSKCTVGATTVVSRPDVVRGSSTATSLVAHCEEYDSNGGDCAVKGVLYCK